MRSTGESAKPRVVAGISSVIMLAVALSMLPRAAQAEGLMQAYRKALTQDMTLVAALEARNAAIEARPQAVSSFLPQLNANAGYARERYHYESDAAATAGVPDEVSDPEPDAADDVRLSGSRREWSLSLRQTLWSFAAFHQLQSASLDVASAEASYRAAQQELMLRVAQAYFDVLAASDALFANKAERESYATLLDQAQKRLSTGLGARIGVDEARAFHELTAQSVIDSETALMDAQRALAQITGTLDLAVTPLAEEIPLRRPDPESADEWAQAASRNNYSVLAASLNVDSAERTVAATRAQHLPSLQLQGTVGHTALSPQLGSDYRADSLGVYVDWPIFSGGLVRSRVREARALQRGAEASLESARRDVDRQARLAYRGVIAGIHKLQSNRRAVNANRTALNASRSGVEVGTRTEFDLLNAQNNYYAALRSYYQSRYDYLTSLLQLKALAGRLVEADLLAIDTLLDADAKRSQP